MRKVDRDDAAGWVLLAMDTTPGNTDTHDFPAKPAKWQYRAIYHAGDSRVGEMSGSGSRELDLKPKAERAGRRTSQWSNPVSVMVGG